MKNQKHTFYEGQKIIYEGGLSYIETILDDGTFIIANPFWDDECEYTYYTENPIADYWLCVDESEIRPKEIIE